MEEYEIPLTFGRGTTGDYEVPYMLMGDYGGLRGPLYVDFNLLGGRQWGNYGVPHILILTGSLIC